MRILDPDPKHRKILKIYLLIFRAYFHYQPSYYHLHVHFTNIGRYP